MGNLIHLYPASIAVVTDANASIAFPPAASAWVDAAWNQFQGAPAEFELEIWGDASRALTAATLYGATLQSLVFADLTVTADNTTNQLAATGHGKFTGDGPCLLTTTGTFPSPTNGTTQYWLIKIDADHVQLALSLKDALAGVFVDLAGNGTGTIKLVDVQGTLDANGVAAPDLDTRRVHWNAHGLLGLAEDGAIDVDEQKAYTVKCRHRPRVIAYGVTTTFGAGTGKISASVYPCREI